MNKYKVTMGSVVKEVEASNEAEARRRFITDNTLKADAAPVVELVKVLPEPVRKRYRVTWGEIVKEVVAVSTSDARTQFVGNNTDTELYKHPATHEWVIEDLGPIEDEAEPVEDGGEETKASPVSNETADIAIDRISRMRSADMLQEVIDHDTRTTVVHAAQRRLSELGGN